MIVENKLIDINALEVKLILNLNERATISKDDFREICKLLKNDYRNRKFRKFEIDFGNAFFELSELTEKLIEKSNLFKNKEMQVVLNLGSHNLSKRDACLDCLRKHQITKYRINYY
jgi:hypothetical protein